MDPDSAIVTIEFEEVEFEDLLDSLIKEIELKNYRVLKVANVDNIKDRVGLTKDLEIVYSHYKIIEFCNLFTCSAMTVADSRAGVFLPQRFALYKRVDETLIELSYLKPTAVAKFFGSKEMMKTAIILDTEMNDVISAIEE